MNKAKPYLALYRGTSFDGASQYEAIPVGIDATIVVTLENIDGHTKEVAYSSFKDFLKDWMVVAWTTERDFPTAMKKKLEMLSDQEARKIEEGNNEDN